MTEHTSTHTISVQQAATIGRRKAMEDETLTTSINKNAYLYAVLDGHSGKDTVIYVKSRLPSLLSELVSFYRPDSLQAPIERAILRLDRESLKLGHEDGTTLCAVLHVGTLLYFINVGDSRAILLQDGQRIFATSDHKPHLEKERIKKAGGVVITVDVPRLNGTLAVSRAIGDHESKSRGLSAFPTVTQYVLDTESTYTILLATDGFWDCFNNDRATDLANIATTTGMIETALRSPKYTNDNVSIVKVTISPRLAVANASRSEMWIFFGLVLVSTIIFLSFTSWVRESEVEN